MINTPLSFAGKPILPLLLIVGKRKLGHFVIPFNWKGCLKASYITSIRTSVFSYSLYSQCPCSTYTIPADNCFRNTGISPERGQLYFLLFLFQDFQRKCQLHMLVPEILNQRSLGAYQQHMDRQTVAIQRSPGGA